MLPLPGRGQTTRIRFYGRKSFVRSFAVPARSRGGFLKIRRRLNPLRIQDKTIVSEPGNRDTMAARNRRFYRRKSSPRVDASLSATSGLKCGSIAFRGDQTSCGLRASPITGCMEHKLQLFFVLAVINSCRRPHFPAVAPLARYFVYHSISNRLLERVLAVLPPSPEPGEPVKTVP
jgi:hypothetical protein